MDDAYPYMNFGWNIGWCGKGTIFPSIKVAKYGLCPMADNDKDGVIDGTGVIVPSTVSLPSGDKHPFGNLGQRISAHCVGLIGGNYIHVQVVQQLDIVHGHLGGLEELGQILQLDNLQGSLLQMLLLICMLINVYLYVLICILEISVLYTLKNITELIMIILQMELLIIHGEVAVEMI
jgi:hypothetical protein